MRKVAILGRGIDTEDVIPWLEGRGDSVTVLDEKLDGKPFGDLTGFDMLVRSPGVYRFRKEITDAEKAGVEVTSKMKIFFDVCPCPIIGVTGTKGKGTTSTLIYEILKAGGKDVYMGGNIGSGVFGFLDKLTSESMVVLELSSFQLVDLHKSPHIAVVLMTTVDHLDWHKDEEEYVQAKANIVRFQGPKDFAVINKDYENSKKIGSFGQGQKVWVSGSNWRESMRLRGKHNQENAVAAAAVAEIVGIQKRLRDEVIKGFKGLEHRLEEVATVAGVTYYEDSFATTPETTIAAVQAFTEPMVLIAGGSEKGADYTALGKVIGESGNVKAVIVIGLMAGRIEEAIKNKEVKLIRGLRTMSEIVKKAAEVAVPGDVVVLSPAAASFDMFKNYKDRGEQFKQAVRELGG